MHIYIPKNVSTMVRDSENGYRGYRRYSDFDIRSRTLEIMRRAFFEKKDFQNRSSDSKVMIVQLKIINFVKKMIYFVSEISISSQKYEFLS